MSQSEPERRVKMVGAVKQAIALLRVLAGSPRPLGASAAARAASVNTSTAFNILRTLTAEHLVSFDESTKTYQLAYGLAELAKGLGDDLAGTVRMELQRLSQRTGCLIVMWEVMGDRVILVDRAFPERQVGLHLVTRRMPVGLGAIGRAILAVLKLSDAAIRKRFEALRWEGDLTLTDFMQDIREAERLGYAADRDRLYLGITAIASVITDAQGNPLYGLSAIEMSSLMDDAKVTRVGEDLSQVTKALSGNTRPAAAALADAEDEAGATPQRRSRRS